MNFPTVDISVYCRMICLISDHLIMFVLGGEGERGGVVVQYVANIGAGGNTVHVVFEYLFH
jgi:hypothetical protein